MKINVNVTARDIKLGHPTDGHSCPIARAIKRVYPYWNDNSYVFSFGVSFLDYDWAEAEKYRLPTEAQHFISSLGDVNPQPIRFSMEAPVP